MTLKKVLIHFHSHLLLDVSFLAFPLIRKLQLIFYFLYRQSDFFFDFPRLFRRKHPPISFRLSMFSYNLVFHIEIIFTSWYCWLFTFFFSPQQERNLSKCRDCRSLRAFPCFFVENAWWKCFASFEPRNFSFFLFWSFYQAELLELCVANLGLLKLVLPEVLAQDVLMKWSSCLRRHTKKVVQH